MVEDVSAADPDAFVTVQFSASVSKSGATQEECEDRFRWNALPTEFRAAVADGASQSLLSGEWAELLVGDFCSSDDNVNLLANERLQPLSGRWRELLATRTLSWYAAAKKDQGAFATLVGVNIHSDHTASALAVGDSCLFLVRKATLVEAFPLNRFGQFSGTPDLIATSAPMPPSQIKSRGFRWADGDDLYLMSDALAEWFLHEVQAKREPWRWLQAVTSPRQDLTLASFVDDMRAQRKIKNDDVTIMHLGLGVK